MDIVGPGIAKLTAQEKRCLIHGETIRRQAAEIERLRAVCDSMTILADAERYRWLRSRMDCVDVSRFKNRDDPNSVIDAEVDAAIDAAREGK